MKTSAKIVTGFTAVTVAGLVAFLVAPAFAGNEKPADVEVAASTVVPAAESTPEAEPADVPEGYVDVGHGTSIPSGGPGECKASTYIWIGSDDGEPIHAEMQGAKLVDMGPAEFAVGDVTLDEQGRPATYTVAPGDVLARIADRFCIYNGMAITTISNYSGGSMIHPGDVLTLNADYATDFVAPDPGQ